MVELLGRQGCALTRARDRQTGCPSVGRATVYRALEQLEEPRADPEGRPRRRRGRLRASRPGGTITITSSASSAVGSSPSRTSGSSRRSHPAAPDFNVSSPGAPCGDVRTSGLVLHAHAMPAPAGLSQPASLLRAAQSAIPECADRCGARAQPRLTSGSQRCLPGRFSRSSGVAAERVQRRRQHDHAPGSRTGSTGTSGRDGPADRQ